MSKKQGKTITVHALREVSEVSFINFLQISRPVFRNIFYFVWEYVFFCFLTTNSHMFCTTNVKYILSQYI